MVFATIISRVFEPILLFSVLVLLTLSRAALSTRDMLIYCSIVFLGILFPVTGLLIAAILKKKISNWDISNRRERVKALAVFLVFLLLGVAGISALGHTVVTNFFLLIAVMYIGFFLITVWFKISGHMAMATLFAGSMIHWFGGYIWVLLLVLPGLAWSRVVLKRHSTAQVILGTLYGAFIVGIGIYLQWL